MNLKTIKDLYHGNLEPVAKLLKSGGKYAKSVNRAHKQEEELAKLLNDEGKKTLEKLTDEYMTMNTIDGEERFIDGFILGAKLMIEIQLYESEELKPIVE